MEDLLIVEDLLKKLEQANNKLSNIINHKENYYYTERILVSKGISPGACMVAGAAVGGIFGGVMGGAVGLMGGFFLGSEDKYRTETRFNILLYNKDVNTAETELNNFQVQLESAMYELPRKVESESNQLKNHNYNLSSEIARCQKSAEGLLQKIASLRDQINFEKSVLSQLSTDIALTQHNSNTASADINHKKQQQNYTLREIEQYKNTNSNLTKQIANKNNNINNYVEALDMKKAAFVLAQTINKTDNHSLKIANLMQAISYDPTYLAFYGIKQNSEAALELALKQKIDYSCIFEGKTLVQHCIGKVKLLNKILNTSLDSLSPTLINIIIQGDVIALENICAIKPECLNTKVLGYNLLHIALLLKKNNVISKLLEIDERLVQKTIEDDRVNILELVLETKNLGLVKETIRYCDIKQANLKVHQLEFLLTNNLGDPEEINRLLEEGMKNRMNLEHFSLQATSNDHENYYGSELITQTHDIDLENLCITGSYANMFDCVKTEINP